MAFHQKTVTQKLAFAFSVLIAILIAVALLSLRSLGDAREDFQRFVGNEFQRGGLARDIQAAANARAIAARNLILLTSAADLQAETLAVTAAHERVQTKMAELRQAVANAAQVPARERELFEQLQTIERSYGPVALAIVGLARDGKKDEAIAKMNAECQPLLKQLISTCLLYTSDAADE